LQDQISNRTWTILGAVVTVVLGGSLLIACVIFFYFFGPGNQAPEVGVVATQTTDSEITEETSSATEIVPLIRTRAPSDPTLAPPTPTFLPVPGGSGTSPDNVQIQPIANPDYIESPEQSVVNYYRDITRSRYSATWSQLTDRFKQEFNCCAPEYNYQGYVDWWDTVQRVDFGDVRLVEQNGDNAVVYAELIYTMQDGGSFQDNDPYIELIYSDTEGRWLFEDKRSEE